MNRLISIGEVRLAFRLIVKQPILSATIILALATGICFATMGFTFWDELVNSALPYQAGERFARFYVLESRWRPGRSRPGALPRVSRSRDDARARRRRWRATVHRRLHGPGEVESIRGALITPRSMRWLDAVPVAGRTLIAADGDAGRRARGADQGELVAAPLRRRSRHDRPPDHDRRTADNRGRHHARHVRVSRLGRVVAAARRADARRRARPSRVRCAVGPAPPSRPRPRSRISSRARCHQPDRQTPQMRSRACWSSASPEIRTTPGW